MSVFVPNSFTANTKIQSAQVNANFTAVLALTPIAALGDLVYASSASSTAALSGNITSTKKFLSQTGTGSISAAPAWSVVTASDVVTGSGSINTALTSLLPAQTNNPARVLTTDGTNTSWQPAYNGQQLLYNGGFDWWQRGTAGQTGILNSTTTYGPDRWYAKNSLGTNGVMSLTSTTGVTNGSVFGCQIKITTAPTAAQANGCELYQTLSNQDSYPLYGQTASFAILVKALNLVTQVGVQFFYATTETKVGTSIGSEQLFTVNSSTFTSCTISGQALGTTQTTAGVIGVRIRITQVSSGNTYDLNNGFICEQAMMNLGSACAPFARLGGSVWAELTQCQRFTYNPIQQANLATNVVICGGFSNSSTVALCTLQAPSQMRANPSTTVAVSSVSHFQIRQPAGTQTATGISISRAGTGANLLAITVASGLTAGQGVDFEIASSSATIYLDSEI